MSAPTPHAVRQNASAGTDHRAQPATDPGTGCMETDRLLHLVEAHRALAVERSLTEILQRILASACAAVRAESGLVAVHRPDGVLDYVVHHNMTDAAAAEIDPAVASLGDIAGHLRIPIEAHDQICGELVVELDPARARPLDEHLLAAFAGTIGAAIANRRLIEDAHRSRDWLYASGEITRALLAGADVDTLLDVVSRALHVAEADLAAIILPDPTGTLRAAVTVGKYADEYLGYAYDTSTPTTMEAIGGRRSILLNDLSHIPPGTHPHLDEFSAAMVVPLADAHGARGALLLLRLIGRPAFTNQDLDLATTFADQVALALEMDEARNDAEFGREIEIRHRIAEQLHDNVMQRLFATGVGLQGLSATDLPPATAEKLALHVQALDDTIDEIREQVFGLRQAGERTRTPGRFPRVAPDHPAGSGTEQA